VSTDSEKLRSNPSRNIEEPEALRYSENSAPEKETETLSTPSLSTDKTEKNSEDITEVMNVSTEDVTKMFQEESRSIEDILEAGRKIGVQPVNYQVKPGGGYATNRDLDNVNELQKAFGKKILNPYEEDKIVWKFSELQGKNYHYADSVARNKGYKLYPLFINSQKMPVPNIYDSTVIGVNVIDSDYDPLSRIISENAILERVVDVGAGAPKSFARVRPDYF
jgi:hypothetical protein